MGFNSGLKGLNSRSACGTCSLMQYKPDWLYSDFLRAERMIPGRAKKFICSPKRPYRLPFPFLVIRNGICDMLTRLWAGDLGLRFRRSDEFYSSSKPSHWLSTSSLIFNGYRDSFSRDKGAGAWSYQSSVSSARLVNECSSTSPPFICLCSVHKNDF